MGSSKLVFLSSQYTDTVVEIQMAVVVFFHGSPWPLLEVRFGLVKAALPGAVATGNWQLATLTTRCIHTFQTPERNRPN